eukprot:7709393-Pyramimonas_sp.AAC.1
MPPSRPTPSAGGPAEPDEPPSAVDHVLSEGPRPAELPLPPPDVVLKPPVPLGPPALLPGQEGDEL